MAKIWEKVSDSCTCASHFVSRWPAWIMPYISCPASSSRLPVQQLISWFMLTQDCGNVCVTLLKHFLFSLSQASRLQRASAVSNLMLSEFWINIPPTNKSPSKWFTSQASQRYNSTEGCKKHRRIHSLTPPHRPAAARQRERRMRWGATRPLWHLQPLCSWLAGRGPQSPEQSPQGSESLQICWWEKTDSIIIKLPWQAII